MTTFDQMAQSIAGYEASAEVTPFTSKFDAVLAMTATFTAQERLGYDLFRGKARCNETADLAVRLHLKFHVGYGS